jgi:hypothetical protein
MPEFHISIGSTADAMRYAELDAFTRAYIECAFWAGGDDDSGVDEMSFADLDAKSLAEMIADCKDFQTENESLLSAAYESEKPYDATQAGHDFFLTRNRHGAGFWDRGIGDIGDQLTDKAHSYGECYLHVENEKVFVD